MPNPKLPLEKARITGASRANPSRYRQPPAPSYDPGSIGAAPDWLDADAAEAWKDTVDEIPWLNRSHRGIVSIVAILRARLKRDLDEMGIKALTLLRACLASLGATPVDQSKVSMPAPATSDPADAYFN